MIAGIEWMITLGVIAAIVIFGGKKLPEWARSFGKAKAEFEKAKLEGDKDIKNLKKELQRP